MRGLLRLARPADWAKNFFVFPAVIASGLATDPEALRQCLIAFVAFCLTASGVYAVNDVVDRASDALHPVKRERPIPAGHISPRLGLAAGVCWMGLGVALGWLLNVPGLSLVLLLYLGLQAAYTGGLKRVAVLDVALLAFGFVLRAFAGAVVIDKPASLWMLACVFFLCLYLAQIKRLCDLRSAGQPGSTRRTRSVDPGEPDAIAVTSAPPALRYASEPATEAGRHWTPAAGYRSGEELSILLGVSAALAVGTLLAYGLSDHGREVVGPGALGFAALTPLAVVVIARFHRRALEGRSDSPLAIALTDPVIIGCGLIFVVGAVVAVYVPPVGDLLARFFLVP